MKWTIKIKSIPYRSAPTSDTTANYQWPPSPILPSISSRTPHLIPETIMPTTESDEQHNNDATFTSPNHHNNNSGNDYNSNEPNNSYRGSIVTQNNNHRSAS